MIGTVTSDAFRVWLNSQRQEVEAWLAASLAGQSDAVPAALRKAMAHALLGGGKRVRPALVILGCVASGGSGSAARPAAVAVEMIHAYSLIHDDLPCMDDDALRRGQPTVHTVFGEALAVLAGDALQALAFETLATQAAAPLAAQQCAVLAAAAGPRGMVGGQVMDMAAENLQSAPTLECVEAVHRAKTGDLLAASVQLGVLSAAQGTPNSTSAWRPYAESVGMLFQATDDLLDATRSTAELGKTAGKDAAAGKATLVAALGLEGARRYARDLADRAIASLPDTIRTECRPALLDLPQFLLDRIQ